MGEYINVVETFGCEEDLQRIEKNHRRRQRAVYGNCRCRCT